MSLNNFCLFYQKINAQLHEVIFEIRKNLSCRKINTEINLKAALKIVISLKISKCSFICAHNLILFCRLKLFYETEHTKSQLMDFSVKQVCLISSGMSKFHMRRMRKFKLATTLLCREKTVQIAPNERLHP